MHYIRLLRPARFDATSHDISLLITITTDLGDSFLHPDAPVDLVVAADSPTGESLLLLLPLVARGHPPPPRRRWRWAAGMRVLDIKVPLLPHLRKEHVTCTVTIRPAPPLGLIGSADVLPQRSAGGRPPVASRGLIMPAAVEMVGGVCSPVSLRTLQLRAGSQPQDLHFEEDIGESIARHIWDAGVVTACFLADACIAEEDIGDVLPIRNKDSFSVLELGSGVGILGITAARILEQAAAAQGTSLREATVLLTDLPEAEERARSNISRAAAALQSDQNPAPAVVLQYENLDWDDGRRGQFGPLAAARAWDLVVLSDCTYNVDSLPALVGTLSALHAASAGREHHYSSRPDAEDTAKISSVLLATKPRHSSEQALFGLLEADGWRYRVLKSIPLSKLGEEDEVVEIYLLEKGMGTS